MKKYIVAIGSITIDEYYRCNNWPDKGSKTIVKPIGTEIGGMIANAASIMGYYGVEVYIVDYIYKGDEKLLRDDMTKHNVGTEYISLSDDKITPRAFIMLSGDERTIFVKYDKPEIQLNDKQKNLILNASYIYTTISDIKQIKDHKNILDKLSKETKIIFDVEPDTFNNRESEAYYFEKADILIFNEFAFRKYCGEDGDRVVINELINKKDSRIIVLTKGEKGSEVITKYEHIVTPGIPANVVDTTGAGDAFNATFIYSLYKGYNLNYASQLANIAGSKAVESFGPKGGICRIDELI